MRRGILAGRSAAGRLPEFMGIAVALHIILWISESEALVGNFKLPALLFRFFELLRCITIAFEREREALHKFDG